VLDRIAPNPFSFLFSFQRQHSNSLKHGR